jgi:hypothetical protein
MDSAIKKERTMTTKTRTLRLVAVAAGALALTAPAAQARPWVAPGGGGNPSAVLTNVTTPSTPVASLPPDRADRIGVQPVVVTPPVRLSPDRADGLGSARLPTVQTSTVIAGTSSRSFDWGDAAVGAAAGLGAALVAVAAMAARGRRRVPLQA